MIETIITIEKVVVEWGGTLPPHLPGPIPIQYAWLGSLALLAASFSVRPSVTRRWSKAANTAIRSSNPQNRVLWFCKEVYIQTDKVPVIRLARRVILYHPLNLLQFPAAFFAIATSAQLYAALSIGRPEYRYLWNARYAITFPLSFKDIKGVSVAFVLFYSLLLEALGRD